MKKLVGICILIFVAWLGWHIGDSLSSDALGMAVGLLFGILAGIPTALLVLASAREREKPHVNIDTVNVYVNQQKEAIDQDPPQWRIVDHEEVKQTARPVRPPKMTSRHQQKLPARSQRHTLPLNYQQLAEQGVSALYPHREEVVNVIERLLAQCAMSGKIVGTKLHKNYAIEFNVQWQCEPKDFHKCSALQGSILQVFGCEGGFDVESYNVWLIPNK